jgi:hypothetical protein
MDHEQGVLAGAGAVHPGQLPLHPEPGLIEPRYRAASDLFPRPVQEAIELAGGADGDGGDRPRGDWDAEQLGQRLRGPLLRQELPDVEVDDDRGDPGPVAGRGVRPFWGRGLGAVPAGAFPLDQLMLGHHHLHRRQVKDLAALYPGDRQARQGCPAPAAAARLMALFPVRLGHLRQRGALMAVLPAGLAPGLLSQRPRPRRLGEPFAGGRLGGVPRVLLQPGLKLSNSLPRPPQFGPCLRERAQRVRQLLAHRCHQRRQHLIWRRALINGHSRTLRANSPGRTHPGITACRINCCQVQARNDCRPGGVYEA